MAMPPKKRANLDVVLPYRRSFITADTLAQTVADVMAEFDKLEIATDELMGRIGDGGEGGNDKDLDALKSEVASLRKSVTTLQGQLDQLINQTINDKMKELEDQLNGGIDGKLDANNQKLLEELREDISGEAERLTKEVDEALEGVKDDLAKSEKALDEAIAGVQKNVDAMNEQFNGIGSDIQKKVNEAKAELQAEVDATIAANQKEVSDSLVQARDDLAAANLRLTELEGEVSAEVEKGQQALQAASANLDAVKKEMGASITTEVGNMSKTLRSEFQSGDKANATKLDTVQSKVGKTQAAVDELTKTVATHSTATAEKFESQSAEIMGAKSSIDTLSTTVANNHQSMSKRVDSLSTTIGENAAKVGTIQKTLVEADKVLGERIDTVNATVGANKSEVQDLKKTVADNNAAAASRMTTIEANLKKTDGGVADANARIKTLEESSTSENGAMAQRVGNLEANFEEANTKISEVTKAQADAEKANATKFSTIDTKIGQSNTRIDTLTQTVNTKDTAMGKRVDSVNAEVGKNKVAIDSLITASATEKEATAKKFTQMQTDMDGVKTSVTSLIETVNTKDAATNKRINDMSTQVAGNSTKIGTVEKAVTDNQKALTQRIDSMQSTVNANKSAITTIQNTANTDRESTASKISALETKYSDIRDETTNIGKAAEDALKKAQKSGQMALNSTNWMKTYMVRSRGNGQAGEEAKVFEIRESQTLGQNKRNWNLVVIDRKTQAKLGYYSWDTLAANKADQLKDMKARLDSFDANKLLIFYTYDEPNTAKGEVLELLKPFGATQAAFQSFDYRGTYILVGYRGLGAGNALEYSAKNKDGSIEVLVNLYRDKVAGINGFTNGQFKDIEKQINESEQRWTEAVRLANAAIKSEQDARTNADGAIAKRVDTIETTANSNSAAIKAESKARTDAITSVTSRLTGAESKVGQAESKITALEKTVTDATNSTSTQLKELSGKVAGNTTKIQEEVTARASAVDAMNTKISNMQSTVNNNDAAVKSLQKTVSDNSSAIAQRIDSLVASVDAASKAGVDNSLNLDEQKKAQAKITTDLKATTDKTNSTAQSVASLTTRMGAAEGGITEAKKSVSDLNSNLSQKITAVESKTNAAATKIGTLEKTLADGDKALASRIDTINAQFGQGDNSNLFDNPQFDPKLNRGLDKGEFVNNTNNTLMQSAPRNTGLKINARDNSAARNIAVSEGDVFQLSMWCATDSAGAPAVAIGMAIKDKTGKVISWAAANRRNASKDWAKIEGTITMPKGAASANVWIQLNYSATDKYWLITNVVATTANSAKAANAAIAVESKARADAISAEASKRETLETKVNGINANVQTVSKVTNDVKGNFESMWGVKTQIGQITAGFGLLQNGNGANFVVDADSFVVADRKGGKVNPFTVQNGVVKIAKAFMDDAYIKQLAASSINVNHLKGATIEGGNITGVNLSGSNLNINNRFIVNNAGDVWIQGRTEGNRGMKISGNRIDVFDDAGRLRVRIGQL